MTRISKMKEKCSAENAPKRSQAQYVEIVGERGKIGKSTVADRVVEYLEGMGVKCVIVRVETDLAPQSDRRVDLSVSLNSRAGAAGGPINLFRPIWDAMEQVIASGGALVVDWCASAEAIRREARYFGGLDDLSERLGFTCLSLVVANPDLATLGQARETLANYTEFASKVSVSVVLNDIQDNLDWIQQSSECRAVYEEIVKLSKGNILNFPRINAERWPEIAASGTKMTDLARRDPSILARTLNISLFDAYANRNYVINWLFKTEEQLRRVPFRSREADEAGDHS